LHERIGRKVFRHDEALSIPAALQISKHMHWKQESSAEPNTPTVL
jgi:hypothetical protein